MGVDGPVSVDCPAPPQLEPRARGRGLFSQWVEAFVCNRPESSKRADRRWVISSQSSVERQVQSALDHPHSAACFPTKEKRRCTCQNSGGFSPIKTADHWTDVLFFGSA